MCSFGKYGSFGSTENFSLLASLWNVMQRSREVYTTAKCSASATRWFSLIWKLLPLLLLANRSRCVQWSYLWRTGWKLIYKSNVLVVLYVICSPYSKNIQFGTVYVSYNAAELLCPKEYSCFVRISAKDLRFWIYTSNCVSVQLYVGRVDSQTIVYLFNQKKCDKMLQGTSCCTNTTVL